MQREQNIDVFNIYLSPKAEFLLKKLETRSLKGQTKEETSSHL